MDTYFIFIFSFNVITWLMQSIMKLLVDSEYRHFLLDFERIKIGFTLIADLSPDFCLIANVVLLLNFLMKQGTNSRID